MRIVCPECGARYDVPDSAVPPPGRDVQCAACTRAWFQLSGPQPAGAPATPPGRAVAPDSPATAPRDDAADAQGAGRAGKARDAGGVGPAARDLPPAPEVPEAVLKILREEAAFEASRRAAAAAPEPRTGAAPEQSPAKAPRRADAPRGPVPQDSRIARLNAVERVSAPLQPPPDPDIAVERPAARRRESYPGLPVARPQDRTALTLVARRRKGFRAGFAVTAGACVVAIGLYAAAPLLARHVPGGAGIADAVTTQGDRAQSAVLQTLRRAFPGPGTP